MPWCRPFLPGAAGGWGPLTANRWWAAFRAAERGTAIELAVRWGFWAFVAVALTLGIVRGIWQLGTLAVLAW